MIEHDNHYIVVDYEQSEWHDDLLKILLNGALDDISLHEEDEMARRDITTHVQKHTIGSTESDCKTAFPT